MSVGFELWNYISEMLRSFTCLNIFFKIPLFPPQTKKRSMVNILAINIHHWKRCLLKSIKNIEQTHTPQTHRNMCSTAPTFHHTEQQWNHHANPNSPCAPPEHRPGSLFYWYPPWGIACWRSEARNSHPRGSPVCTVYLRHIDLNCRTPRRRNRSEKWLRRCASLSLRVEAGFHRFAEPVWQCRLSDTAWRSRGRRHW